MGSSSSSFSNGSRDIARGGPIPSVFSEQQIQEFEDFASSGVFNPFAFQALVRISAHYKAEYGEKVGYCEVSSYAFRFFRKFSEKASFKCMKEFLQAISQLLDRPKVVEDQIALFSITDSRVLADDIFCLEWNLLT